MVYLFPALIYNGIRKVNDKVSMVSVLDVIGQARIQYIVTGKEVGGEVRFTRS